MISSSDNIIENNPVAYGGADRKSIENFIPVKFLLILTFLFSMWDIYLPQLGLRIFDFIGVGLLLSWLIWKLCVNFRGIPIRKYDSQQLGLIIVWCLVYSVVGVIESTENLKPITGVLMGVAVFSFFYTIKLDFASIKKVIEIIIVIHAFYLIFQYLYYHNSGIIVNLSELLGGEEPRALSSIFRPTGLFLEPAAYSVSMMMLLAVRIKNVKSFDAITFLALGTIFFTLSLWGFIANIIFLLMFARKNTIFFVVIAFSISTIILFSIGSDLISAADSPLVRITSIADDSSGNARFGGLFNNSTYNITAIQYWLGKGISNDYLDFGSSGLAFIMSAGGLLGTGIFIFLLITLIPSGRKFVSLVFILLFMTSAPIMTTMFCWFWLALMTRKFENGKNFN